MEPKIGPPGNGKQFLSVKRMTELQEKFPISCIIDNSKSNKMADFLVTDHAIVPKVVYEEEVRYRNERVARQIEERK